MQQALILNGLRRSQLMMWPVQVIWQFLNLDLTLFLVRISESYIAGGPIFGWPAKLR